MNRPLLTILRATALLLAIVLGTGVVLAQGRYTIDENWAQVPGGDWGGATSWVAPDGQGNIVVMVRTAPYFRVFTREGAFVRAWGETPEYRNAHSIIFDSAGNMWATDAGNHVVYKYNPAGEIVMTLGRFGEAGDNASTELFNQPNHVAIAANGDIFVSDGYGNARIVQFDATGHFIRIIAGVQGAQEGELQLPHGIALDSLGRLIVNDSDNKRISVFAADGHFLEAWAYPSRGGLVVGPDDTVYVSDVNAAAVNILRNGEVLDTIEVGIRPHGLAVDADGTIYVCDARGQKVVRITRQQ